MRFVLFIVTILAVGVSAGRRATVPETSVRPSGRGHFGWGMPMDNVPIEDIVKHDEVKEGTWKNHPPRARSHDVLIRRICSYRVSSLTSFILTFTVSTKKVKQEKKLPECTEFHRRWHLPCCEHCSDVDKAFDSLE